MSKILNLFHLFIKNTIDHLYMLAIGLNAGDIVVREIKDPYSHTTYNIMGRQKILKITQISI